MADPFEFMMGYSVPQEEQLQQMAGALRGQNTLGQALQMTGLGAAQSLGQNLGADALRQAAGVAQQRRDIEGAKLARTIAQIRAQGKNKPHKLTVSDRKQLKATGETLGAMNASLGEFKDEYTQQFGPGPQSQLANTMARYGLGTEKMEEAEQWWSNWNRFYTLETRNRLFGATLTPNEQRAWNAADINPSMDPDEIRTRVSNLLGTMRETTGRELGALVEGGYNPDEIKAYMPEFLTRERIVEDGHEFTGDPNDIEQLRNPQYWRPVQ
jgi:hypothetical protein